MTREHVWPQWALRYFPSQPDAVQRMTFNFESGDDPIVREWPAESMAQVARVVCADCNNGWMSTLETDAKPWVEQLIHGVPTLLDSAAQKIVGEWCIKTGLLLSLTLPQRLVDPQYFREFFKRREPPGHGVVYLSSYEGDAMSWYHVHGVGFFERETEEKIAHGWVVSFVLGHLAVQLTGSTYPERMRMTPDRFVRMGLIQIAPEKYPIRRWPRFMRVADDTLDAFARIMLTSDPTLGPNIAWIDRASST